MRWVRDSNPHRLSPGGFQDRCTTIMRTHLKYKISEIEQKNKILIEQLNHRKINIGLLIHPQK